MHSPRSAFFVVLALLTSSAGTQVPDPTLPAADQHPILTVAGRGAQIYTCQPAGTSFKWIFLAPVARLFDAQDREVGTHGDGPRWTYQDGSSIGGTPVAKAAPDPASIPWLLLRAATPQRRGILTGATYIRRSDTHGGLPPSPAGCDADHKGDLARVPYTATYTFYAGPAAAAPAP